MKGMGLRKIRSGTVENIDPHLLGRLIGKQGKALRQLKEESECRVIVGDNGRLWIDGDFNAVVPPDPNHRLCQASRAHLDHRAQSLQASHADSCQQGVL